jgi:CheY-like chemotaxis protein
MTANVMKEDRDKCINSGMNDFIPKPIKMNNLNDTLLKWT